MKSILSIIILFCVLPLVALAQYNVVPPVSGVDVDLNGEAYYNLGGGQSAYSFFLNQVGNADFSNAVNQVSHAGSDGGQTYGAGTGISTNGFNISVTGWLTNLLNTGALTNNPGWLTNGGSATFISSIFSNSSLTGPLVITNNTAAGILITNPASGTFVLVSTNGTETNSMAVNFTGTTPAVGGNSVLTTTTGDPINAALSATNYWKFFNDATNTGTSLTLKNTGTAATYRSVTFDAQGRETSGSNPTTFAGYGISDTWANFISAVSGFPAYITGIANVALTNTSVAVTGNFSASGEIFANGQNVTTNSGNGIVYNNGAPYVDGNVVYTNKWVRQQIRGGIFGQTVTAGVTRYVNFEGTGAALSGSQIYSGLMPTSGFVSNLVVASPLLFQGLTNINFYLETNTLGTTPVASVFTGGLSSNYQTNLATVTITCQTNMIWDLKLAIYTNIANATLTWSIDWWHQ